MNLSKFVIVKSHSLPNQGWTILLDSTVGLSDLCLCVARLFFGEFTVMSIKKYDLNQLFFYKNLYINVMNMIITSDFIRNINMNSESEQGKRRALLQFRNRQL